MNRNKTLSGGRRLAAGLSLATLAATSANASLITGGSTEVRLDPAIAGAIIGAGVTPAATGTGILDLTTLTFTFPITGGTLSDTVIPGSTIEHDGSGIIFSAGTTSLAISNFVIDTTTLGISGGAVSTDPATGDPLDVEEGVPLFSLSAGGTEEGFPFLVALTDTASGALNATFGTDLFDGGLVIGAAGTAPVVSEVPEPDSLPLLAIGLGMIGLRFMRRDRAA